MKKFILTPSLLFCFTTLLYAQPANDNCDSATTLTLTATAQDVIFNLTQASVNFEEGCVGLNQNTTYSDVWYQFTMPTAGGVTINSGNINRFALFDTCNGTQLICSYGNNNIENLSENQTYFLRVFRSEDLVSPSDQSFSIKTIEASAPDCSITEAITISTTSTLVNFDLSTQSLNYEFGCDENDANSYKDIWYEFTMPVNGSINITSNPINRFALYDTCNGNQIDCYSNEFNPHLIDNLNQGENYLLRVYRNESENASSNNQEFTIQAIEPFFPSCSNVEMLTVSTTLQTIDLDLNAASYNYELGCSSGEANFYADFWYQFTMPVNGNLYINPTIYNNAAIYDSCGGTILYCDSGNHLIDDLVQGQTYTLRIFRNQSTNNTFGQQISIKVFERITNDDCANAEVLPTLTSDSTQILFELAGATVNTEETCAGTSDYILDAWWQFTMPITGNLFIDTPDGNGIAVYDSCNGNEIFCNASEGSLESFKLIDGLTEGETYLIRLFNTETTLLGDDTQAIIFRVYNRADNDVCADAEVIPTITSTSQEVTFDTFGSLINFEESCSGNVLENFVDVWFEFTMPEAPYLKFESYLYNFFTIFDACNGNEIECFASNETIENLVPNQTYKLRVFQRQNVEMFHPYKFFNIYSSETLSNSEFKPKNKQLRMIGKQTLKISDLNSNATLSIFNLLGQRLNTYKLNPNKEQTININAIEGIYIAYLNNGSSIETLKFNVIN
jgi:hypothetical protein